MITVRSTAGLPTIPITDATIGPGSRCPLGAPDMAWYGGGDGTHPFYTAFYNPLITLGSGQTVNPQFANGFDTNLPWFLEAHCANSVGLKRVREEYVYFECTSGWRGMGIKITLASDSVIGAGFEIRESTAPVTRDGSGYLYDYAGPPNLLLEPFDSTQTVYVPTRTGVVLVDESDLSLGGSILIAGPMAGRALVFMPKNQDPEGVSGLVFSDFDLELGDPV